MNEKDHQRLEVLKVLLEYYKEIVAKPRTMALERLVGKIEPPWQNQIDFTRRENLKSLQKLIENGLEYCYVQFCKNFGNNKFYHIYVMPVTHGYVRLV